MAHEIGAHAITVNALAPGGIDTDMSKAVMTAEYRARRIKDAVFLAAEEAGYLTGRSCSPTAVG